MSRSSLQIFWLLVTVAQCQQWKYLFTFGDSYTKTGFQLSKQPQPSPGNPFGNPPFPGSRFTAPMYLDIISTTFLKDQTPIYNFAVGANPVNNTAAQFSDKYIVDGPVKDFRGQELQFEILNRNKQSLGVDWNSTNSLFMAFFGINDVAVQIYMGRDQSTSEAVLQPDIDSYWALLDRQYRLGARNFMTILVPPIYRAPVFGYGKADNAQTVADVTAFWNSQMIAGNQAFMAKRPKAKSRIFDPTSTFNQILNNPQRYGAPNATCYSKPDGQPCLWRDFIHPGVVIQRALGLAVGRIVTAF